MKGYPVATRQQTRAYAKGLALSHPRELAGSLVLHILATVAGLVAPWLLGDLVGDAGKGGDAPASAGLAICAAVTAQALLTRLATFASARLSERILARLREDFIDRVLSLPLEVVERAGTGELVTRTTRDSDILSSTVQLAAPDTVISLCTVLLTLGAIVLVSPVLVLPCLVAVPALGLSTRWYLRRARPGYLRANATYSQLAEDLSETINGAQTVEALRTAQLRAARTDEDIARSYAAERRTLYLRSVYLPIADTSYMLPVVATLLVGGLLYVHGVVTLAAVTAATLYVQQIITPVDRLLFWMDELQIGGASLARILGLGAATNGAGGTGGTGRPDGAGEERATADRALPAAAPAGRDQRIVISGLGFGYKEGREVLHDIDLVVEPGERLAMVGPSGAGKSTLARLIAGVQQPTAGSLTIGGVPVADIPPARLRRQVSLVTQEYHVFRGSLRDNLLIAAPDADDADLRRVLRAVDAWEWAKDVGLDTEIGSGGSALLSSRAQQVALARLILADPHTLVLDEATSLLDPHTARRLERGLAAVLEGRTVIAVAHRLHTARDADRIVVMEEGRIVEVGSHDELIERAGPYADLWRAWHGLDVKEAR